MKKPWEEEPTIWEGFCKAQGCTNKTDDWLRVGYSDNTLKFRHDYEWFEKGFYFSNGL